MNVLAKSISSASIALLLCASIPAPIARAEIFRWVDASGRMHFTQDLGQVPAQHRAAAKADAAAGPKRKSIQHYVAPPARTAPSSRGRSTTSGGVKEHRIPIERAGSMIRVVATLNGRVQVPFYIDTGASDVSVPMWAARELGLKLDGEGVRKNAYMTANGVIEKPVVRLESVELGTARVEGVVGSVSDTMEVGLLGLSFFNHFETRVDAANGVVTLRENQLAEDGLIRGGRSESQWRGQFYNLNGRIAAVEAKLEEVPFSRTRMREEGEAVLAGLQEQLEILEDEADDARVPFKWRD